MIRFTMNLRGKAPRYHTPGLRNTFSNFKVREQGYYKRINLLYDKCYF